MKVAEKLRKKRAPKAQKQQATNRYGISEDYTGKEDGYILKIASVVLKKRALVILIMTVIFAVFMCVLSCVIHSNECKATMMLNYEQSVDGLAPNGTRFNISDFKSDEVINLILKNSGAGDEITAEELSESITIYSLIAKQPINEESYYIPTSYKIVYKAPRGLKSVKPENMMKLICNTYSQYFYDSFTMNSQILNGEYELPEDFEYSKVGAYLKLRVDAVSDYLRMRSEESGKFKSQTTGETFNSIKKMADNLSNYDLSNYNAFIWEKGIVHHHSQYTNTLNYLNSTNAREETLNMNEYLIRREVIEYYNTIMSTSILIPTVNSKNNYYMARTKTGVDYLASKADYYLATAKGLEKTIQTNSDKLSKVEASPVAENHRKADAMINKMINEITNIEELAIRVDKEYKEEYAKNYITFEISDASILSSIPKKKVLLFTAVFMALTFYVYYLDCSYIAKRGKAE